MTVKKEYICNFCHNTNNNNAIVRGVLWKGNVKVKIVRNRNAENHLCDTCLKAIHESYNDFINNNYCYEDNTNADITENI